MEIWVVLPVSGITLWLLYLYIAKVASVRLYADKRAVLAAGHDLDAGGTFKKKLAVDEARNRGYLRLLARRGRDNRVYTLVTLTPESARPHDRWAVAIKLGRQTLGYLSRDDARQFRLAQRKNGWPAPSVTCPAAITGRHTKNYGVWLDLPAY